jgi:predicted small metal-binding protein
MRVIDCDCGKTLQAANDDDLVRAVREHVSDSHPEMGELTDDQVHELVGSRAYDAEDA